MKYLKTLAVAAVVMAGLMALAGVASATVLTVTTENGTTNTVTLGAKLEGELAEGESVLKSSFIGEVKCKKSAVAGSITSAGGAESTVDRTVP